jgi:hydroxyacylglutathione hydrolase
MTHGHIDHAMGAFKFEKAYIHSKEYEVFQINSSKEVFEGCFFNGLVLSIPKKVCNSKEYRDWVENLANIKRPFPQKIDDIKSFDLGDRKITWINIPGHTSGSICIVDENNGVLFTGDDLATCTWLQLEESVPISEYKENLNQLNTFCVEKNLTRHYQAHTQKSKKITDIDAHIRCCDKILAKKKSFKVNMNLMSGHLMFCGLTMIVFK